MRPRRAFEARAGHLGRGRQCRRLLPDHPYSVVFGIVEVRHDHFAQRHDAVSDQFHQLVNDGYGGRLEWRHARPVQDEPTAGPESEPRDNAVEPVRCRFVDVATGPASADFEHMADLPLTARRGLTASFRAFDLLLTDMREDGTEVLVLDDGGLRNLPQFVKVV
jgi:hypothetical protein